MYFRARMIPVYPIFDLKQSVIENDSEKFIKICEENPNILFKKLNDEERETLEQQLYDGYISSIDFEIECGFENILYTLASDACNGLRNNLEILSYIFKINPDLVVIPRYEPPDIMENDRTTTHRAAYNNYIDTLEFMLKYAENTFYIEDIYGFTLADSAAYNGAYHNYSIYETTYSKMLFHNRIFVI